MSRQAEVQVHGTVVGDRTLLECTACGPVAVTDLSLMHAIHEHLNEHDLERSNR